MFKLCAFALLFLAVVANPIHKEPSRAEKKLEEAGFYQGDMRFPGNRNVLTNINKRWPFKIVYYEISSDFLSSERNVIYGAMNAIQSSTCVTFVRRTTQTNYVYITRENSGCWSYVGMITGRQELNLQEKGCVYHGTIIHEFLHSLGMHHQQSASNRDDFVTIQYNNIEPEKKSNFEKYSSSYVTDFGVGYDYSSIMHYGPYAFSKNGQKTMLTRDFSAIIGQRSGLSSKDIAKIEAMYSC